MILFNLTDQQWQVVVQAEKRRVGWLRRSIRSVLRSATNRVLEPPWMQRVKSRSHMLWLLRTVLAESPVNTQPRAGPSQLQQIPTTHPALWCGSCFQDLAGARVVKGLGLQLWKVLPRLRLREVYEIVGLPPKKIQPATSEAIHAAGAKRLATAVAAALAADPALKGNKREEVTARRVVAHIANTAGISPAEVTWALGLHPRSVYAIVKQDVDRAAVRAACIRIALENTVASDLSTR